MKKLFNLLLAFGLCLGLMGCSSNNSDSKKDDSKKIEYVDEKDIKKVYTDPDKYKGKHIKLSGQVFSSVEKSDGTVYFQMLADPVNSELNTVVKSSNSEFDLESGKYIKVEGEIIGKYDGENSFGGSVNAVAIEAKTLEYSNYKDVVSPTIKEIPLEGQVNVQNNVTTTISKVEFAKNETRIYYSITNNSGTPYSYYNSNIKLIQNGKQYEPETNFEADYPEISGDILNGVTSESIVAFPAIEQANFEIYFDSGYSDNYDLDFSEFTVPVTVQ